MSGAVGYLLIKFVLVVGAAAVWGLWTGLTGRDLTGRPKQPAPPKTGDSESGRL